MPKRDDSVFFFPYFYEYNSRRSRRFADGPRRRSSTFLLKANCGKFKAKFTETFYTEENHLAFKN